MASPTTGRPRRAEPRPVNRYVPYSYLTPGKDFRDFELVSQVDRVPAWDPGLTEEQAALAADIIERYPMVSLHDHVMVLPKNVDEIAAYRAAGRVRAGYEGLSLSGLTMVIDNVAGGSARITSHAGWKWTDTVHELGMRIGDIEHQDDVIVGRNMSDIQQAFEQRTTAVFFGLEAATAIENELDRIDVLYGLGVRQSGIVYSESNTLGTGLSEGEAGGLTKFGHKAVERMNAVGMMIDISHANDRTGLDTIAASSAPVLITHAGARGVWPTPRMKPDEVLRACADSGGVLGLEAAPHSTISPQHRKHSIDSVMDHLKYCIDLIGVDHVAFGPDAQWGDHVAVHRAFHMGGFGADLDFEPVDYVEGLENPTENFRNIVAWLVRDGFSDEDIAKIIGGNAIRVLARIWRP